MGLSKSQNQFLVGVWWRLLWHTQGFDYGWLLPAIASLPLRVGYRLAAIRGRLNAWLSRDWRSMSLGRAHIATLSRQAYGLMPTKSSPRSQQAWVQERFMTESRCDFEAYLVDSGQIPKLGHRVNKPATEHGLFATDRRGLVLLTSHFDSFYLGLVLIGTHLAQENRRLDVMSSAVFEDPMVHPAITRHLRNKYRGLEQFMGGGKVMHHENGLRQFYDVLGRGGILVVIGDIPATQGGASIQVEFLGAKRNLAGGAVRMARKCDSRIGSFTCTHSGGGNYQLDFSQIMDAKDPAAVQSCYSFLSSKIQASPGKWWAADMLTQMPAVTEA